MNVHDEQHRIRLLQRLQQTRQELARLEQELASMEQTDSVASSPVIRHQAPTTQLPIAAG